MKRNQRKKLLLTAETVRSLSPGELARVPGALGGASANPDTGPIYNSCNSCPCHHETGGCPM